jgi:hypothetical protein
MGKENRPGGRPRIAEGDTGLLQTALPMGWVAAGMEAGDDLNSIREQTEKQTIRKAPDCGAANEFSRDGVV